MHSSISHNGKQKGETLAIEEKCIGHLTAILGQRKYFVSVDDKYLTAKLLDAL